MSDLDLLRRLQLAALPLVWIFAGGCGGHPGDSGVSADAGGGAALVHLEDRLADATVRCAPPEESGRERVYRFDGEEAAFRTLSNADSAHLATVEARAVADGVRLTLSPAGGPRGPFLIGGLRVDVEGGTPLTAWETVLVRARSTERLAGMTLAWNVDDEDALPQPFVFFAGSEAAPVFSDGSEQTYALPLAAGEERDPAPLESLGILVGAPATASIEILSLTLVPRGSSFEADHGIVSLTRDGTTRRTLYAHTPATLAWRLPVAEGSRLDVGLAALAGESVTYRVRAGAGADGRVLLEETVDAPDAWKQRSVALSAYAGGTVDLVLEAEGSEPGAVALWGAPIVSGRAPREERRPDVIFYVIDGGGADLMSVYGYDRPTTPFLERLARDAAVFTRAYSNATWTQPSTASFMTSLQHSVLGGLRRGVHSTPIPSAAVTMAEHMRRAGYQTASFTTNPNCARMIGLERGIDWMRDVEEGHASTSSAMLHERFREFRAAYPGTPYWVHFQTTDVHEPNEPEPPFRGRFVSDEEGRKLDLWQDALWQRGGELFGTTSIVDFYDGALARAGVPRHEYYELRRGRYDETMAHQDRELERFVEQLRADGDWEHTLLVIGADHGHPAGTFARFGRGLTEPKPPGWEGALFDSWSTRVPLIFVWPGQIPGGQRFDQPVSMIDVLPTLLDLLELPPPEVVQGQSLAPLLRGGELDVRPVFLDEFRVDGTTGEMIGNLEIIDGRWGRVARDRPGRERRESTPRGADRRALGRGAPGLPRRAAAPALRPRERPVRAARGQRRAPRARRALRRAPAQTVGAPPRARAALPARRGRGARPRAARAAAGAGLRHRPVAGPALATSAYAISPAVSDVEPARSPAREPAPLKKGLRQPPRRGWRRTPGGTGAELLVRPSNFSTIGASGKASSKPVPIPPAGPGAARHRRARRHAPRASNSYKRCARTCIRAAPRSAPACRGARAGLRRASAETRSWCGVAFGTAAREWLLPSAPAAASRDGRPAGDLRLMKSRSSIWDAPTLQDALRTYGEARTLALLVEAFHATERPADGDGPHAVRLGRERPRRGSRDERALSLAPPSSPSDAGPPRRGWPRPRRLSDPRS